ncbi:phytanoyl-CoA dioxygenase family protein [Sphingobacterium hungaricum]|uniref:Phytanoyl-CoA dioxygenase n=1 Tax=Sphingobacterium hungaricum TaxID=2082723 RepID=A0A928YS83_9SPHI|nr:phytanoyl-CoA dioxygenase family protein [Sphingobacterium hungaricum]MBE8714975.1 phytanoyl-CoA dioxygenase [Sphingobacterium hungaricum]
MQTFSEKQIELTNRGFAVIDNIYTDDEINKILEAIQQADRSKETFRQSADLFAIRQFLKEFPELQPIIFNEKLNRIIHNIFGKDYFVVKSIYFDKPATSNWYVAYHQDLTISVDRKLELKNYGPWTTKQNQFAVQPPISILENNFTIRIHLDQTDENNGALRVIEGSHLKGVYRPEEIDWSVEKETICAVNKCGIILMKPLLLHSSARTTNQKKRRVIHIEFSNTELPDGLNWSEKN